MGRTVRIALFGISLILFFGLTAFGIVVAVRDSIGGSPAINLNIAHLAGRRLPLIATARANASEPLRQIVVLGDSTIISYRPGRQLPDRIEADLRKRSPAGPKIELVNLAISGVAAFDYYFLADEIVRARPDGVLFAFNLDTLSKSWRSAYSRPELAGMISPGRLLEAAKLPIHWTGLTVDRLLFYVSIVQSGAYDFWYALSIDQARLGRVRIEFRDAIEAQVGSRASLDADQAIEDHVIAQVFIPDANNPIARFSELGVKQHYADAMMGLDAQHPVLMALGALLSRFRRAEIPAFVFVTPANVQYMDSLGMLDRSGLARTIAEVEQVVRGAGADFIDLHALLPNEAFRDGTGHFRIGEKHDGPLTLAEALGPPLLEHIAKRYSREATDSGR